MIMGAPWYVPNAVIRRGLQIQTVREEIRRYRLQIEWDLKNLFLSVYSLPR
jgi:hypothetical protein